MHFQFLIEDQSSEKLIDLIMKKVISENSTAEISYNCKGFKGIGGFTQKNTVKETKTGKLLNDLTTYLKGFDKSLSNIDSAIFIILDNDDRDVDVFRQELEAIAQKSMITIDYVFCIAIEEVEAWLLGDENAIRRAYPKAKLSVLHTYIQDSICGTWETLANVIYPGGISKMKKTCVSYMEIGAKKAEWAYNIGKFIDLEHNNSPSFKFFISELYKRIS